MTVATGTRRQKRQNGPFTLAHFERWAAKLILDNGKPWKLEPFQKGFVADLFSGVREVHLIIPEGNGKTTLLAALALYHCEHRREAYVAIAAASRDQTRTIYRQMEGFIQRSPELHDTFEPFSGYIKILCAESGGEIKIWSASPNTGDGIIPTFVLIEEAHRHRDMGLYRLWLGKLGKRTDGVNQIVLISTAGEPYSEFEDMRSAYRQMADDVQKLETFGRYATDKYIVHEWAVPEGADTEDLDLVTRANPLLRRADIEEKRASPSWSRPHWNRMVCGQPTRDESAAIEESEWLAAQVSESIPENQPVWLGLDIGWKTDTSAFVPLWSREKDYLLGPATVLAAPADGTQLRPESIKAAFREIRRRNPVQVVVMDVYTAEDIKAWLESEGVEVRERLQTAVPASEDYERFMAGLRNRTLLHTGDKMLTRHAMATAAKAESGKTRFTRLSESRRAEKRIQPNDALIAAAMVYSVRVGPKVDDSKTMRWFTP